MCFLIHIKNNMAPNSECRLRPMVKLKSTYDDDRVNATSCLWIIQSLASFYFKRKRWAHNSALNMERQLSAQKTYDVTWHSTSSVIIQFRLGHPCSKIFPLTIVHRSPSAFSRFEVPIDVLVFITLMIFQCAFNETWELTGYSVVHNNKTIWFFFLHVSFSPCSVCSYN